MYLRKGNLTASEKTYLFLNYSTLEQF
uniref:Uncharacterized protein n=1 Tax=Anguilla anguilla TaxID=7936 RepID=A0A0E9QMT4_ANGAN